MENEITLMPLWLATSMNRPVGSMAKLRGVFTPRASCPTALSSPVFESIEKMATLDPRRLVFKHFRLGDLDLAQWWVLQAQHDLIHLGQIRDIKHSPGFPG